MIKYYHSVFFGIASFLLYAPAFLYAQGEGGGTRDPGEPGGTTGGPTDISGSATLDNPLGNQTLIGFFNSILDVILVFAVPIIVFFIIYAGFKYVMARGNPTEIQTANQALLYAVIGGVLILGAKILLVVIQGTIEALRI